MNAPAQPPSPNNNVGMTKGTAGPKTPKEPNQPEDKEPRGFADRIDQIIRDHGFSVREAKTIRKVIFDRWARALRRGEIVETPLGEMQAVRAAKPRARITRLNNKPQIVGGMKTRGRRIKFRPSPELVEKVPTKFYAEEEAALLEKLGRKPWATTEQEDEENVNAIKAARTPAPPPVDDRLRMSPYAIAARAQRSLKDLLPPPPRGGRGR